MPGGHARFLEDVIEAANIRDYVSSHSEDVELTTAFNEAIKALTNFRDKHLQLVSRYIIIPSRLPPPAKKPARQDLAAATTTAARRGSSTQELVGTGGTKLLPFLKQARNDTTATALDRPL